MDILRHLAQELEGVAPVARKKDREREKPRFSSRSWFAAHMHRRPCRWDVLIHELAGDLAKVCWQVRPKLKRDSLRIANEKLVEHGRILARGFEILLQQRLYHDESLAAAIDAGMLLPEQIESLTAQAEHECFNPLLRKSAEDVSLEYVPSKDPDAVLLARTLADSLREFLADRCGPGGDLRECLTDPLPEAGAFFPPKTEEEPLPPPAGRPSRDIQRLAVIVFESDDPVTLKYKLGAIAHQDPWLSIEWRQEVLKQAPKYAAKGYDAAAGMQALIDQRVFRATRLWGKTPIDILLERQPDMPPVQRRRLERWRDENRETAVIVKELLQPPFVFVEDLMLHSEYRLRLPKPHMHKAVRPGMVMHVRVVPWDDVWALTGVARGGPTMASAELDKLRRVPAGPPGIESPLYGKAVELQQEQYRAWMDLFGRDEMVFDDGRKLADTVARYYTYWTNERVNPDTGKTPAQLHAQQHGEAPATPELKLPEHMLRSDDVGILFHPLHGMLFVLEYGLFRSAFGSDAERTKAQLDLVWEYLTEDGVSFCIFQRMRELYPAQTERVFRLLLREDAWQLDRDFEPTLRKYKGEQMRRPPKAWLTPV